MKAEKRIASYEAKLNRALKAAEKAEAALEAYEQALPDVKALEEYYTGPEWKKDHAADEAGLLPDGLKRGVLSEDGIWNMLERFRDIRKRMQLL